VSCDIPDLFGSEYSDKASDAFAAQGVSESELSEMEALLLWNGKCRMNESSTVFARFSNFLTSRV